MPIHMELLHSLDDLHRRARRCPLSCSLKVLLLIAYAIALAIAVRHQGAMTFHQYFACLTGMAYVAILMLVSHAHCQLDVSR